ncbi:hypothetical protein VB796_00815 [Arcicella sp. LKC2W]|uniref:hypothetical protein n=1 Tax=Arcicella sp. LKC2W TaxID=2984198 RepID=UPI002B1FE60B|nr:hypothetical protein [Arcicella sp. LKC2W]MEA5457556.1 hypothetical protein [Arcicella sp. LKC2W]
MVKLGIICEGESETIIFNSLSFISFLQTMNLELVAVQETGSKNQFYEERINSHRQILIDKGATHILTLLDLDKDGCITITKQKLSVFTNQEIVVAVKEFENWYLADSIAISHFLGKTINVDYPENYDEPIDEMIRLKGFSFAKSKPRLARKMLKAGFSIQNAANHPNCPSAKYFLTKLQSIANN